MKVYVLETGEHGDRVIQGVYSTPEKAMAAWHPAPCTRDPEWARSYNPTYTWDGGLFDGYFDDAARLYECELDDVARELDCGLGDPASKE